MRSTPFQQPIGRKQTLPRGYVDKQQSWPSVFVRDPPTKKAHPARSCRLLRRITSRHCLDITAERERERESNRGSERERERASMAEHSDDLDQLLDSKKSCLSLYTCLYVVSLCDYTLWIEFP